jgi:hypothetical protein
MIENRHTLLEAQLLELATPLFLIIAFNLLLCVSIFFKSFFRWGAWAF